MALLQQEPTGIEVFAETDSQSRRRPQRKLAPWMEATPLWLKIVKGITLLFIAAAMPCPSSMLSRQVFRLPRT